MNFYSNLKKSFVSRAYQKISAATAMGVMLLASSLTAYASSHGGQPSGSFPPGGAPQFGNPIRYDTFMEFIRAILEVVLRIGIPVAAIFIIYSGFLFIKAQGNEEKLSEAKRAITYTIIGTAILLGSWLLATGIQSTIDTLR